MPLIHLVVVGAEGNGLGVGVPSALLPDHQMVGEGGKTPAVTKLLLRYVLGEGEGDGANILENPLEGEINI